MDNSRWRRCGTGLATMLAAGLVGAVEINSSLAPLILHGSLAPLIPVVVWGGPVISRPLPDLAAW